MSKFKVGDRVRIVNSRNRCGKEFIGDVVTIVQLTRAIVDDERCYHVTGRAGEHCLWFDDELEFIKKEFTKADLKNGDVIKRRDGSVQIVCLDVGTCICQTGNHYDRLIDLNDDLTHVDNRDGDIIAVRRPLKPLHCCFDAFALDLGELVYERKEVEEMTLAEVCAALGKEIKIVKE